MRSTHLWVVGIMVLSACYGAPAYREPAVSVSPAFGVVGRNPVHLAGQPSTSQPAGDVVPNARSAQYRVVGAAGVPFWREIGDATLGELVTEALRASPSTQSAEARLAGARASRRLAAFDLAPTVTASSSALRSQQSVAQLPGLTTQLPSRDLYDVGFDAAWEIDIFGRVQRNVSAQGALVASAEHALEDVQVSLAAEVARTYFELRGAERQLAVARRNADNQQRTVSLTQDRLAAGRGTAFDTERARSILQLTLAGMPPIESQIAAHRHRLATLLGRTVDALPSGVYASAELPSLPDTVNVGSPQELVRRRPDVLRAERQLAASELLVGAAQADYLPRLTLGASVGYASTRVQSLTSSGMSRILVGPVLSFPLLDVGRVRQRVDIAEARQDDARVQYTAAALQAVEEAETALVAYDRAHARVAILTEAVGSSTRAAGLAQQRFEAGLTDFFQVLDAQRTQLEAETQLAVAHTSAATALVAVYKSVGGTWPMR
jgi:NodT family efflux transporter outer membrane factor (OMF) lipoprotein